MTFTVSSPFHQTPWSRIFPLKLTALELVNKFPSFYGTQRFITAFTSPHHLSLFWATLIQSLLLHPSSQFQVVFLNSVLLWCFFFFTKMVRGVHSCLRHFASSLKVAGSITDGDIRFSQWLNPSGHTVVLGLTPCLTEMRTKSKSLGVKAAGAGDWQDCNLDVPTILKFW